MNIQANCMIVWSPDRMRSLLQKFRINCTDIIVIDDIHMPPSSER